MHGKGKATKQKRQAKRIKLALAIVSALTVALIGFSYLGRTSPGPLSAVHARIPELNGWQGCSQCDGGIFGDMTSSCLECHEDISTQLEERRGLHGSLDTTVAQKCARCHSDHHGEGFQMVHRGSFAQAGIRELEGWDHAEIGYTLAGKHLTLACKECHEHAETEVLPEGEKRYLGLQRDCASCHEDAHAGQMSQSCASCHSQESFETVRASDHERHVPLVGGHEGLSCRECHAKDSAHALEIYSSKPPKPRTCKSCHDSPHGERFVLGNAGREPEGSSCKICHVAEHTSFRDETLELSPAQHAHSGFALAKPHDTLTCEQCHDPELAKFAARYPRREQDACQSCHEDPHGGQFAKSAHAAQGCRSCHARTHFEPHTFLAAAHAKTRMPLTGAHAKSDCASCHREDTKGVRRFHGTAGSCDDCHSDAHGAFFAERLAELVSEDRRATPNLRGSYGHCHSTENFSVAATRRDGELGFDHARWTRFPIRGAHRAEGCETCHRPREEADEHGRRFGRCNEIFGPIQAAGRSCVPCHKDPHGGAFDRDRLPSSVNGRTGCARCHTEVSFRALQGDFDHGLWTGFALTGRHKEASCSSCHEPRAPGDAARAETTHAGIRSWSRAKGRACADCHDDPHAGQFAILGKSDCAKCHQATQSFSELRFKHDLHSRFKLGEQHRSLACASCHKAETRGDITFVRYKPLGRACADCHKTRARPFRRRR